MLCLGLPVKFLDTQWNSVGGMSLYHFVTYIWTDALPRFALTEYCMKYLMEAGNRACSNLFFLLSSVWCSIIRYVSVDSQPLSVK